jgi:hypothetical protein
MARSKVRSGCVNLRVTESGKSTPFSSGILCFAMLSRYMTTYSGFAQLCYSLKNSSIVCMYLARSVSQNGQ